MHLHFSQFFNQKKNAELGFTFTKKFSWFCRRNSLLAQLTQNRSVSLGAEALQGGPKWHKPKILNLILSYTTLLKKNHLRNHLFSGDGSLYTGKHAVLCGLSFILGEAMRKENKICLELQ